MLTIQHLRKSFGPLVAVDDVSFGVERGTLVGLLGPNGAGKTTTVSMIAGLTTPDKGDVLVEGARLSGDTDPKKRRIGLVPQDLALYEEVSARANLELFGALYRMGGAGLDRAIDDALALVGLADRARDKVASFSGGMKRRLNIAGALLHDPELLLFDEPTVGVDPQSRNAIFDNLAELKRRGKTLVYTTHYMEEAERLCDRIVVVDHGKVLADDTLPGLLARADVASRLQVDLAAAPSPALVTALAGLPGVHGVSVDDVRIDIGVEDLQRATRPILEALSAAGCVVRGLASDRPNLESVFLTLTGRSLRD